MALGCLIVLGLVVSTGVIGFGMWQAYMLPARAFSSERWIRGPEAERGTMVHDLLARHLKHGMTEAQVRALLGVPNTATDFALADGKLTNVRDGSTTLFYTLGQTRDPFSMGVTQLAVGFGPDGRLSATAMEDYGD